MAPSSSDTASIAEVNHLVTGVIFPELETPSRSAQACEQEQQTASIKQTSGATCRDSCDPDSAKSNKNKTRSHSTWCQERGLEIFNFRSNTGEKAGLSGRMEGA
eukprot:3227504-Rhodomonas_salina.1